MLSLINVSKKYSDKEVLKNISLSISKGDFVSIIGKSGSGKTTLLKIIGMIDSDYSGTYEFNGEKIDNKKDLTEQRKANFGFIFQSFFLDSNLSVYENVEIPLLIRNMNKTQRDKVIIDILKKMGIEGLKKQKIKYLSGGEKQRVAIARALVINPNVILADEPTGALDINNGNNIMEILKEINKSGITIILITHDLDYAKFANKIYELKDGVINECL